MLTGDCWGGIDSGVNSFWTATVDTSVTAGLAARLGAAPAIAGRRRGRTGKRPRGPLRRLDETGGVVSLWVVLMVPVSAFAAVVAMAGPQRMAAESSMREAANDMATMAVAERYVHQDGEGQLTAFPLDCDQLSPDWRLEQERLETAVNNNSPPLQRDIDARDGFRRQLDRWREVCEVLEESIVRDLGNLGVDVGSLRGFYSDSLRDPSQPPECSDPSYSTAVDCTRAGATWFPGGRCSDPTHNTAGDCTHAGETWSPAGLCRISDKVVVQDAVHVALAADWQDAGWAAAQVWPDGRRLGAESIGRRARAVAPGGGSLTIPAAACDDQLDTHDSYGRPVVLQDPSHPSRQLSEESETRTPLSG